MDVRLDGAVALVTGGGGAFGRAYSRELGRAGARVAVVDRRREAAEVVASLLREEGSEASAFAADAASATDLERTVAAVKQQFGDLSIVLNLAGDAGKSAVRDLAEADWDYLMTTNLKSMFLSCKAVIPTLIERGGGRIINMASSRGIHGQANGAHYAATKGGIIAFTRSLAAELQPFRITVNALAPGATDTPMWERARTADEVARLRESGTVGLPEDLAPFVTFLASDFGYPFTGQLFVRDVMMPR